jgi:hypothetical protein
MKERKRQRDDIVNNGDRGDQDSQKENVVFEVD